MEKTIKSIKISMVLPEKIQTKFYKRYDFPIIFELRKHAIRLTNCKGYDYSLAIVFLGFGIRLRMEKLYAI